MYEETQLYVAFDENLKSYSSLWLTYGCSKFNKIILILGIQYSAFCPKIQEENSVQFFH